MLLLNKIRATPGFRSVCLVFFLSMVGCKAPAPTPPPFPEAMIKETLDVAPNQAHAIIERHYPGSEMLTGGLRRVQIAGSDTLDEVVLFTDLRSERVNTVILKYKASLSGPARAAVLDAAGVSGLQEGEVVTVEGPFGGTRLRARSADRQGRLTLTVEPEPDPR